MILATALTALLISNLLAAAVPPPHLDCVAELVAFSPCLPFVSAPPNNFTATVPVQCCDVISSVFNSTDDYCFCYLLRQPMIFGFPLNDSRVISLPSVCLARTDDSLESVCASGAQELPPLLGDTNPESPQPSYSRGVNASTPASTKVPSPLSSQPNSTRGLPKLIPAGESDRVSFALSEINSNGWYLGSVLVFFSYIHM
ncbi:hypothetical protein SLE2022_257810 [Rubroshorea leprosula]